MNRKYPKILNCFVAVYLFTYGLFICYIREVLSSNGQLSYWTEIILGLNGSLQCVSLFQVLKLYLQKAKYSKPLSQVS